MSTRRLPLTSNPNVANSPLRGSLAAHHSKRIRSHAELQREEAYGQPPPAKRQMIDAVRPSKSPSAQRSARAASQRLASRSVPSTTAPSDRSSHSAYKLSDKEIENIRQWQAQTKARLPKMVFYFESVPDDQRVKLAKQASYLGAREEKFFSIAITHVVTTRPIPSEKAARSDSEPDAESQPPAHDPPRTIDPSLLNRTALDAPSAPAPPVRRKLLFDTASTRRLPMHVLHDDASRRAKARNTDVLVRAREMGKKIWSLDKLQKILDMVLEPDPYKSAMLGQGLRSTSVQGSSASRAAAAAEPNRLLQLLRNEQVHGPSDRDPTVTSKELNYFKGPYLYVYDIEEKQKPIMVREYAKVPDKKLGDWPQFRVAAQGRCPFIEDSIATKDGGDDARAKERAPARAAATTAPPASRLSQPLPPKPVIGKRTLTEMEGAQNRGPAAIPSRPAAQPFDLAKVSNPPTVEFRTENAFTSRAKAGRLFAGEPVASGVQPSNVTSAIRSQMVSSTTGALGVKAGTSKEIHGLQRQVLQKNSTSATAQDSAAAVATASSRHDGSRFTRSASVGKTSVRRDGADGDEAASSKPTLRRAESNPAAARAEERKHYPRPGYCENCREKFRDFDEHVVSRKHRKFAENTKNWVELDTLLSQLKRPPKYRLGDDDEW